MMIGSHDSELSSITVQGVVELSGYVPLVDHKIVSKEIKWYLHSSASKPFSAPTAGLQSLHCSVVTCQQVVRNWALSVSCTLWQLINAS